MKAPHYPTDDRLRALLNTARILNRLGHEDSWPLTDLAELANVNERWARRLMGRARMNTFAGNGSVRGKIILNTQSDKVYYEQ